MPVPSSPQGRVNDHAGVLSAEDRSGLKRSLRGMSGVRARQRAGGAGASGAPQIAVVVLPTLNGDSVEDAGLRFAERWKIGSKAGRWRDPASRHS